MTPTRIQRRRTKGWRMPEGAVYVGRPTVYGNPFTIVNGHHQGWLIYDDRPHGGVAGYIASFDTKTEAARFAVEKYRDCCASIVAPLLVGRDLACWCPLDQPCHADVLLDLANRP